MGSTYTFYANCVELGRFTNEACMLRRWYGPISKDGLQVVMCYDEVTLMRLLKLCKKHNVTVHYKKSSGLNQFEYLPYEDVFIDNEIERISKKCNNFKVEFKEPTKVSELKKYDKGTVPLFAGKSSTAAGSANCKCGQCVGNLLVENGKMVGWIQTLCDCNRDINWSTAEEYL